MERCYLVLTLGFFICTTVSSQLLVNSRSEEPAKKATYDYNYDYNVTVCLDDEFLCAHESFCVKTTDLCNGQDDCGDKSDEQNCTTVSTVKQTTATVQPTTTVVTTTSTDYDYGCIDGEEFTCVEDGFCIPLVARCDQTNDCSDNSDEFNCPPATTAGATTGSTTTTTIPDYGACEGDDFDCGDGVCLARIAVCDGVNDCDNLSDESDCVGSGSTTQQSTTVSSPTTPNPSTQVTCLYEGQTYPAGEVIISTNCTRVDCSATGQVLVFKNEDPVCGSVYPTPNLLLIFSLLIACCWFLPS